MNRRSSLFARLALALLAIVLFVGALYLGVTLATTRAYQAELTQSLHHDLAANLVKEADIMIEGEVQDDALYDVFHTMMVVNPAIEVYLLDAAGEILSYSAPYGVVVRDRVDLGPVRRFLAASSTRAIVGDDPRHAERRKVFSAATVGPPSAPQGYLYVVLGGQEYDSAAALLRGSYIARLAAGGVIASLLVALLGGLGLLYYLTRRLRRLSAAVESFEESDFRRAAALPSGDPDRRAGDITGGGDEIDRLGRTFGRMAERLVTQLHELRHLDRLRRDLVANVSHDLRTPLTSLRGYLDTLRFRNEGLDDERRARYLEIASRQASRLEQLVAELFELAKLDSGGVKLDREAVAMTELVQDIVAEYRLAAEQRGVRLEAGLPEGLARVHADTGLLARVLQNLLDNALEHTPAGGRVRIAVGESDGTAVVEITDTGSGIPEDELPHLFDRYFYGASGRRAGGESHGARGHGNGLGLAIARKALELHGASIAVDSEVGAGSTFSFELPLVAA